MNLYENLLTEAENENLIVAEKHFRSKAKGIYKNGKIGINRSVSTSCEGACILAEEMGHYFTSFGNILDQKEMRNVKQEKIARNWAYEKLIPLDKLISAYEAGIRDKYELIEYLDVIEEFLLGAIKHYKEKYGLFTELNDYIIYFEPLGILKFIK